MPQKSPGIISFWHATGFPRKEIIVKFLAKAERGKKLGLEITKTELEKYERIWSRTDFPKLFAKIQEGEITLIDRKRFGLNDIDLSFFSIATLARDLGLKIVPLDSPFLLKRAHELESKLFELGRKLGEMGVIKFYFERPFQTVPLEKVRELQRTNPEAARVLAEYNKAFYEMRYIETIAREEHMSTIAKAEKVDLICVGVGHHDEIQKRTSAHTIHKDKFYISEFRKEYNKRIARAEAIKLEIAKREREKSKKMPMLPKPRKPQKHKMR